MIFVHPIIASLNGGYDVRSVRSGGNGGMAQLGGKWGNGWQIYTIIIKLANQTMKTNMKQLSPSVTSWKILSGKLFRVNRTVFSKSKVSH